MKIQLVSTAATNPLKLKLDVLLDHLSCGFPNPASGLLDSTLDLNEHLIKRPSCTYFAKALGRSLEGIGIIDGDCLIIDRGLTPKHMSMIVACINGEYMCKQLDIHNRQLLSASKDYPPIPIPEGTELETEGVIIHAIHHFDWR